jgi:hypothetical protein
LAFSSATSIVGGLVLDTLIAADRLAEGDAHLGVGNGYVQHLLRTAAHLRGQRHSCPANHPRQRRPTLMYFAEQCAGRQYGIVERDLAQFARASIRTAMTRLIVPDRACAACSTASFWMSAMTTLAAASATRSRCRKRHR